MTECFERDDNTLQTESRTLYCQFVYQDTSKLECEPQEAQKFPSFFDFGQCGHVILWGSDRVRELSDLQISDLDGIILRGDLTMRQHAAGTKPITTVQSELTLPGGKGIVFTLERAW